MFPPNRSSGSAWSAHVVRLVALGVLLPFAALQAQQAFYESEPNDTPAEANAIRGAVDIFGTLEAGDQDGFTWTVSDDDARKRWTFELQGVPGRLTTAEVVRIEPAADGTGVAAADRLMKMGTRDGLTPSVARDLLFEPGDYLIGIAHGGGTDATDPGGYRFNIREGRHLHVGISPGAGDTRETAQALRPGQEFGTFESRQKAWYGFTFSDKDVTRRWNISAQAPVGRKLAATLHDAAGSELATAASNDRGHLVFPDLAPEAATYFVTLAAGEAGFVQAVASEASGERVAGEEAEPNGEWSQANRVDLAQPLAGRVGADHETDYFVFTVDETGEGQALGLRVDTEPAGQALEFCLLDEDGQRLQCRNANAPIELPDLVLAAGNWGLLVARGKEGTQYRIGLSAQGPAQAGMEAEPNDAITLASSVPANQRIKGRFSGNEDDYFRFVVADEPQLWRFQVIGDDITEVAYHDGAGRQAADSRPDRDQRRVQLENVFLLPGQHYLKVSGRAGGSYTVLARALGPPDPNGELEPNGDESRMQRLSVGQVRTGLLAESSDTDYYRFFLGHWDQVRLTIQPAADAIIHPELYWYGGVFANGKPGGAGEPVTFAGLFPPGDYHVILRARQPSDAEYRLSLDRLPRFACVSDCAPDGPSAPPVELAIELERDTASAFRTVGQRVPGTIVLRNAGDAPVDLALEATTSDYRWEVVLQQEEVRVPANGRLAVPLELRVPRDAWADHPVRLSARAATATGSQAEGWTEVGVDRDLAPVRPDRGWDVPDVLRGGLNVAWAPFGARLTADTPSMTYGERLFDGLVLSTARIECCGKAYGWGEGPRPEWTLDLPGQAPLPVAGVALNHFGSWRTQAMPRTGALLLSADGERFEEVLRFETLPVLTEQFFALAAPVSARFARLRIDETFGTRSGEAGITLGEWKVILQPGHDLSGGAGFNLADLALGGHVVSDSPPEPYSPVAVLDASVKSNAVRVWPGDSLEYVIGFHHNRAAQIERIEWLTEPDMRPENALERVVVSASTESPVGPWRPLGELTPRAGAAPAVLALDAPAWARFVRLTGLPQAGAGRAAAPSVIRVWERPAGPDYRSVLAEWGYGSPMGFYESSRGMEAAPELQAANHDARARAARLAPGQRAGGEVALARRDHWYRLQVPAGENTLTVRLSGEPTVRTRIELQEAGGGPIPMRRLREQSEIASHLYEAVVAPGSEVFLRVFEPPRNVVFSWDTSASVIAHLPVIYNALAAFSSQVIPGQEAVNLMPFGRSALLRDWHGQPHVLQTILNDYPRTESSSAAEETLKHAAQGLAPLAGSKSIVVITDGETIHDGSLWAAMQEIRPQVFGVHIAGSARQDQDVFEDWASVNGGHYTQLYYRGEMEVAFDRAATMMRRPAGYTLMVTSEFREAPGPGRLRVVTADGSPKAGGAGVELILDASGSMLKRMQGKRRIDVAKTVLTEAVREHIPAGTPVALRVFGHREVDSCRTDLELPLAPLDPEQAAGVIGGIEAMNLARTPIAASLAAVAGDMKGVTGRVAVVLVTDGEETCEGDPGKVIQALRDKGFELHLNIVGFAIDDAGLAGQFASWAELGGGRYFAAQDQAGLSAALQEALQTPFAVFDVAGTRVAEGVVGGEPLALEQGIYRVEVATSPARVLEGVQIAGEKDTSITLD